MSKILVVDYDRHMVRMLTTMLEAERYSVISAWMSISQASGITMKDTMAPDILWV